MILIIPRLIGKSFSALSIYPFIILKKKESKDDLILINHERIHLQQQKELLWFIFFLWYGLEYLIKLAYYRHPHTAYRNLSFEREAYYHEKDLSYLQKRKLFSFLRFLKSNSNNK